MTNKERFQEARASVKKEFFRWTIDHLHMRPSKTMVKSVLGTSIYTPHQGEQEKARRVRQITSGFIKI